MNKDLKIELRTISKTVCKHFNIHEYELFLRSRVRTSVTPRQIFHYLSWKMTKESLTSIGKYYDEHVRKYDHATVLNSKKVIENQLCEKVRNFKMADDIRVLKELVVVNQLVINKNIDEQRKESNPIKVLENKVEDIQKSIILLEKQLGEIKRMFLKETPEVY